MNCPEENWANETMDMINRLTPDIKGKAFDPGWFKLAERLRIASRLLMKQLNWIEALEHHATDGGRVTLSAQLVEEAAISMREANPSDRDAITTAERQLIDRVLAGLDN